jgi:hypothetical protein
MSEVESKELPEETRRWLDLAPTQIASLRAQVNEHERLRVAAKSMEEENARLRGLADDQEKLRTRLETSERLGQELREEVDRLRAESHQHREREEVADSLTTILSELLLQLRPQLAISSTGDPGPLTSRFEQALLYAKRLHARRVWKGTQIPYIAHPLSVAALVLEDGGDEDEAIGALLHDAVEAEGGVTTLEDLRRRFGDRVARTIEGCRDPEAIPTLPWRARKERFLEHLRRARPDVLRVSAAETLHDARMILADYRATGESPWSRLGVAREDIGWYYRSLVDVVRKQGRISLAEQLGRVAEDIEAGPTRAATPVTPRPGAAGRPMFGFLWMASVGGVLLVATILVWAFQSTVNTWWSFVRPLLHP